MKKIVLAFAFVGLLSSCAQHFGSISSSSFNQPVQYKDVAIGVAKTHNVLGIGGTGKDALTALAKKNLIQNYPLKPNEAYANFTVDFKRSWYPFYFQQKVTVTADVVDFDFDKNEPPLSEHYLNKQFNTLLENELFEMGDTVVDRRMRKAVIFAAYDNDNVQIKYLHNDVLVDKSIHKIFSLRKEFKGTVLGDKYAGYLKSEIVGLGLKRVLVLDSRGNYLVLVYPNNEE